MRAIEVIESPDIVKEIASKARHHVLERFSEERMVLEHAQLYQEILGRQLPSQQISRPLP